MLASMGTYYVELRVEIDHEPDWERWPKPKVDINLKLNPDSHPNTAPTRFNTRVLGSTLLLGAHPPSGRRGW